jgi:hypothetical protein
MRLRVIMAPPEQLLASSFEMTARQRGASRDS